jgi:hypothetical protein
VLLLLGEAPASQIQAEKSKEKKKYFLFRHMDLCL